MSMSPESAETISACRALFLQRFDALLKEAPLLSGPAIQAILRGVGIYFDDVIGSRRGGAFRAEVDGMTASRLTLVDEDDLELEIRLDNLSAKLFRRLVAISGRSIYALLACSSGRIYRKYITQSGRTPLFAGWKKCLARPGRQHSTENWTC